MDNQEIKHHWQSWAEQYKTDLRATTKTSTLKNLEIDALARAIQRVANPEKPKLDILEVGAGNGHNCLLLAELFPDYRITGVDYIPQMVENARALKIESPFDDRVQFYVGDVLDLSSTPELAETYDIVFTDRCLINLNSLEKQKAGIDSLIARLRPGGYLLMIENSRATYDRQNDCREALGLQRRTPDAFNIFFDEEKILAHLKEYLFVEEVEDFLSLHDLMLYVLIPSINGGKVDYTHPLVEAATKLNINISAQDRSQFGSFGQNRLYICRKG